MNMILRHHAVPQAMHDGTGESNAMWIYVPFLVFLNLLKFGAAVSGSMVACTDDGQATGGFDQMVAYVQAASDIRLLMKPGGQSKGCAYVQFATADDAKAALVHDQELYHGKHILVAPSEPPGHGKRKQPKQQGAQRQEEPPESKQGPKKAGHKGHKREGNSGGKAREPAGPASHPHKRLGGPPVAAHEAKANEPSTKPGMDNVAFREMLGL